MELQPVDSLKIIQDIIRQRKQKYEENGFFLIFWSVLIALSGIVQFVMLATDYYPKYSWIGWGVLMPLGFFISFFSKMREGIRNRKEQKSTDPLDWLWLVAGLGAISCFCLPYSNWKNYEIALLVIYLPFSFVSLAIALHLRISLWIVTSIIGIILTYSVLFLHYGIALPLLCAILACLLFLIPGIQFYSNYKKQKNVQ
jgi:putative membrane protein